MCGRAKLLQAYPTLCDPMNCSPPGSSVREFLQARILEWVAMFSSRGFSQLKDQTHVSYVSCISRQVFTTSATWEAQGLVPRLLLAPIMTSILPSSFNCSVQFSSVAQSCLTLCDPMNRSTPDLPVHHQLPEFTQTHVH